MLLDLDGEVRARRSLATGPPDDPARVISAIAQEVDGVIGDAGVDRSAVLGVGIGVPGPVDLTAGTVDNPPNLPAWHQVPLREELARVTGMPVVLDKDVVAAVAAEIWRGPARPRETLAVVYVGTGIGVGVSIDGEIVRGASGNAGEVGHIVVDPDGPRCGCGLRGCVAVTSAPTAVVARLHGRGRTGDALAEIMAAPHLGERARVVDAALHGIARLTLVVADLYDVDHIVYGGPFWRHLRARFAERAMPALRAAPVAHAIHGVRIEDSAVGEDLGAIGAGSLVLDRFFSPRTSSLALPG